jgi:conjugal transfer pilus assembly protein TrbC
VKALVIYYGERGIAVRYKIKKLLFVALLLFLDSVFVDTNASGINKPNNEIYVFISFSMPDNLIRDYIIEARNYDGTVLVLRGFYKNSFRETTHKINKLGDNKQVGVIVDPTLYQKYNIQQVPSIVRVKGNSFDKIDGSISIKYALEKFEENKNND